MGLDGRGNDNLLHVAVRLPLRWRLDHEEPEFEFFYLCPCLRQPSRQRRTQLERYLQWTTEDRPGCTLLGLEWQSPPLVRRLDDGSVSSRSDRERPESAFRSAGDSFPVAVRPGQN